MLLLLLQLFVLQVPRLQCVYKHISDVARAVLLVGRQAMTESRCHY
jgi:hypothetical protein